MGEIRPKRCEGRELTKDQLARRASGPSGRGGDEERAAAARWRGPGLGAAAVMPRAAEQCVCNEEDLVCDKMNIIARIVGFKEKAVAVACRWRGRRRVWRTAADQVREDLPGQWL